MMAELTWLDVFVWTLIFILLASKAGPIHRCLTPDSPNIDIQIEVRNARRRTDLALLSANERLNLCRPVFFMLAHPDRQDGYDYQAASEELGCQRAHAEATRHFEGCIRECTRYCQ